MSNLRARLPVTALKAIVQLVVAPAVVGAATGTLVSVLRNITEVRVLDFFASVSNYWVALLPLAGLLLTLATMTWIARSRSPSTTELYIDAFHSENDGLTAGRRPRFPLAQVPGRYLAGMTTVGFGGSQGLESPSTILGAGIGTLVERIVPGTYRNSTSGPSLIDRLGGSGSLLIAGAAAGIAAIFSSPGVGMLFAVESPYRRDMSTRALIPAAVAAGFSYVTYVAVGGDTPLVDVSGNVTLDWTIVAAVACVAVACGIGARLFAAGATTAHALAHSVSKSIGTWQRITIAGALLVLLAALGFWVSGAWITFGPGEIALDWALTSERSLWLLVAVAVIHSAGTLTTVFGSGGGGVFVSMASAGALLGQFAAVAIGRPGAVVLPLIGAACFLGAGYRIPLAGVMLVADAYGHAGVIVLAIAAVVVSQAFMGNTSSNPAQRRDRFDTCAPPGHSNSAAAGS